MNLNLIDESKIFDCIEQDSFTTEDIFTRPTKVRINRFEIQNYHEDLNETYASGIVPPDFKSVFSKVPISELNLYFVQDVFFFPEYGVLVSKDGGVFGQTYAEASYLLGASPPPDIFNFEFDIVKSIEKAYVFMPWGACKNYGHFIIDAIGGAVCLSSFINGPINLVCPTLNNWQREILHLLSTGLCNVKFQEYGNPILHVKNAVYTSAMNHYLHSPTKELRLIEQFLLPGEMPMITNRKKIYISRSKFKKRVMTNEQELISALVVLGFEIISPEELGVRSQIELFACADVIVSASGAGLANLCFSKKDTLVFEIQPDSARNIWIRNICHHKLLKWRPFFVSDISIAPKVIGGIERKDHGIEFSVDVNQLLLHLRDHGAL